MSHFFEELLVSLLGRFVWWQLTRIALRKPGIRCAVCDDELRGNGIMCPWCRRGIVAAFGEQP